MKTRLDTTDSKQLVACDIDSTLASYSHCIQNGSYYDYYPIFTLQNLLEILPKQIKQFGIPFAIVIKYDTQDNLWHVSYENADKPHFTIETAQGELIDSIADMIKVLHYEGHIYNKFIHERK